MRSPAPHRQHLDRVLGTVLTGSGKADSRAGTVSVWYGDLDGVARYTRDAHAPHYAASTMKLPLLVAAHRLHAHGDIDLDAMVPVHNAFRSAWDGSPFSLDRSEDQDDETWSLVGRRTRLRELVRRAITRSGNLATNLVLEQVGTAAVAEVLVDAGCSEATTLPRGIEDAVAREAGLDNRVTAADLARIACGVAARTLAAPAVCAEAESVLSAQEHRDMIPAGLPSDVVVANKTGWVTGVAHDVAIVRPADTAPYVLAVCTTVPLPEQEAQALVATISRHVWQEHIR